MDSLTIDKRQLTILLVLAIAAALLSACGPAGKDAADLQRESLRNLYYKDGPVPPAPGEAELARAVATVNDAQPWEQALLTELYPEDSELWAYAIRDTDGDGVHDFRVSDYFGRFLEGDTDIDGDNLDNALDPSPFTADTNEQAQLPAEADWAAAGKPRSMTKTQKKLLGNHRVLLVDRSASFTPALARAVDDALTRVYRSIFGGKGMLSTLRIISTEESSLLYADAEEGSGDFAQVLAATQTMEIYRPGIDAPPVIQLGFRVHEIGHNIQFEMDFDARRQEEIMRRNVFVAEHFHDLVTDYGWTTVAYEADPETDFTLFRPQYISPDAYSYLYYEETPEEWAEWLGDIYAEVGEDDYLTDPRLLELYILGDYSVSGPWEWYSDHLIAYVYIAMIDSLKDQCEEWSWDMLRHSFQEDIVRQAWPYFRFENARGAPIQDYLAETFPLEPNDVDYLAEYYLADLLEEHCR